MEKFAEVCLCLLPSIIMWHIIFRFIAKDSKFQKNKFRKSLDCISKTLVSAKEDGLKYPTVDLVYRNKNFSIGLYKRDHSYYYHTYEIFINGDEAGIYHQIGDCCSYQYYFEKQNNREQLEVMEIINAASKKIKKYAKATVKKTASWKAYSYFE